MPFCPACGAENPAKARFCRECRTRLEKAEQLSVLPSTDSPNRPLPPPPTVPGTGPNLDRLCVWLGLLGIPGIVVGAILIRRRHKARGRPLAAVILGSVVMIVAIAAVAGLATRPDPLSQPLNPESVPTFAEAVTARIDELQEEAEVLKERLGPGAEGELAPFYSRITEARNLAQEMELVETEEELDSLRELVLEQLDDAQAVLSGK
jgi:hypothetical protein